MPFISHAFIFNLCSPSGPQGSPPCVILRSQLGWGLHADFPAANPFLLRPFLHFLPTPNPLMSQVLLPDAFFHPDHYTLTETKAFISQTYQHMLPTHLGDVSGFPGCGSKFVTFSLAASIDLCDSKLSVP